jgi:hypothetical protein
MASSTFRSLLTAQSPPSKDKEKDSRPLSPQDPAAAASSIEPSKPRFRFLARLDSEASEVCSEKEAKMDDKVKKTMTADEKMIGDEAKKAMAEDEEMAQAMDEAEEEARKAKEETQAVAEDKANKEKRKAEDQANKELEEAAAKKQNLEDNDETDDEDLDERRAMFEVEEKDEASIRSSSGANVKENKRPAAASSSSGGAYKRPAAASSSSSSGATKCPAVVCKRPAATMQKRPAAAAAKRPAAEEAEEDEVRKRMCKKHPAAEEAEKDRELDSEEPLSEDHEVDHSTTDEEAGDDGGDDKDGKVGDVQLMIADKPISGDDEDKLFADSDAGGHSEHEEVEEEEKQNEDEDEESEKDELEEEEDQQEEEEEEEEAEAVEEEEDGHPRIRTVGITKWYPGAHGDGMTPHVCFLWLLGKLNGDDVQTALEFLGLRLKGNLFVSADVDSTLVIGRDITGHTYADHFQHPNHTVKLKLEKRLVSPGRYNIVMTCKLLERDCVIKQLGSLALIPDAGGRFNQFLVVRIFMGWRCIALALDKKATEYPGEVSIGLMIIECKRWRSAGTMRPFRSLYP